jgi:hypothetical protein
MNLELTCRSVSLAAILLTAVPVYLRQIVATNLPAASSLIREEFSQDQRPYWFNQLPEDIQSYLIKKFGPPTATPTPPLSGPSASESFSASVTTTAGSSTDTSSLGSSDVWSRTRSSSVATPTSSAGTTSGFSTRTSSSSPTQSTSTSASSESLSRSASSSSPSSSVSSSFSSSQTAPSESPTDTPPDAPPVSSSGLSHNQKIGLGVGIPIGIVGAAIIFLGCCFLLRRRRDKRKIDGSVPPSDPGFIPRGIFASRSMENVEHQTPLTRHLNQSSHDLWHSNWDEERSDSMEHARTHNPYAYPAAGNAAPFHNNNNINPHDSTYSDDLEVNDDNFSGMSYSNPGVPINNPAPIHYSPDASTSPHDPRPVMAFHTHSSNRARGMRMSYQSLRSVAEQSEPDDDVDSPVLGRHVSQGRSLMGPASPPLAAAASQIKRKPVGSPPPQPIDTSPAAAAAQRKLLRQTMPEHSGSSSSGLALSTSTANTSMSSGLNGTASAAAGDNSKEEPETPISPLSPPLSNRVPSNPFSYDYVEDYGPEYHHSGYGFIDVEDGLYGGNTSLSRYPEPKLGSGSRRKSSSKTEWPLRNLVGSGSRRKSSPLWDRIYEE